MKIQDELCAMICENPCKSVVKLLPQKTQKILMLYNKSSMLCVKVSAQKFKNQRFLRLVIK